MMDPRRRMTQPGPALEPRVIAVPCRARHLRATLPAGATLLDAITAACGAGQSAVLHLQGGGFGPFHYVMPSFPTSPSHAAFYSDAIRPAGLSRLEHARVTFGTRDGKPWLHCHGFWTEADGTPSGGHVIPDDTTIADAIDAEAWILDGAAYVARHDPETNFTLFAPEPAPPTGDGSGRFEAIRLRPNQDVCETLATHCATQGVARALLRGGVASTNGTIFDDGREYETFPTELFVLAGTIGPTADIDIATINAIGERAHGRIRRGANPVLMTVEVLLESL